MPAGDRKIPEPIVVPTRTAIALQRPRVRGSSAGADEGEEDGVGLAMALW
jgi:hypothetical protein